LEKHFLEGVGEGKRNDVCARLAGHFLNRKLRGSEVEQILIDWNDRNHPPMPEDEVRRTFDSIFTKHQASLQQPLPADQINKFNRTDTGNAQLFAALFKDVLRYDHKQGRWLIWKGHYWGDDTCGELDRMGGEVARVLYKAAWEGVNTKEKQELSSWALGCESRSKREAILALGRSEETLADNGEGWNADPWLLAVKNGVVDLRTGQLTPGTPEQKISRHLDLDYHPEMCDPSHPGYPKRWYRFLREIFSKPDGVIDQELLDFICRCIGYTLTGSTREQCLFILYGQGANGKSTFLAALRKVLGSYAMDTAFTTFELKDRQGIPSDLAALEGARMVTASETGDRTKLNEGRIKAMSGGDAVTARHLYSDYFTYQPTFKLWLSANCKPRVSDDSHGFWRRVRLIPFENTFDPSQERNLLDTLQSESEGILALAVAWALEWQKDDLRFENAPEAVKVATEEYQQESDPLGEWITDAVELAEAGEIKASDAYNNYCAWASANGMKEREQMTVTAFGRRLKNRFKKVRHASGLFYQGLREKTGGM
jgi:putative DNA primase/helicase